MADDTPGNASNKVRTGLVEHMVQCTRIGANIGKYVSDMEGDDDWSGVEGLAWGKVSGNA